MAIALGAVAMAQKNGQEAKHYSYATRGVLEIPGSAKLLLDESILGGKELEIAEFTFPAGTVIDSHKHGSVEILYVLSGTLGHEVNGKLNTLTQGMIGIVRPGDSVRHIVPKNTATKLLVIWAPAGEAKRLNLTAHLKCPFPQVATYKGTGNTQDGANFTCKGP